MSSDAVQQVRACLKDEDHYKKGRKKIIQQIDNGNRLYTVALVDTVKTVLKDKKEPGVSKFIALYFLKEAMDTKDPELVNYVKEKTLSRLSEIAKSDTSKIFPSKTEDKILRNFDQLLLECIVFWAEWFGSEKGGSKYKSTLAEVKQKVELPKKYSFFVTKKKKEEAPPDSGKPAVQESTKKEESKQASSKPGKKEPIINKIQELLSTQEGNKEMLMESISGNNKPDINVLQIVNDQFIDIDKELQEAVNVLFPMEFPEKEGILNRVLEETSFTSKYLNDFKKLQKKQMSLDEFKSSMLVAIGGTKGQNKGKEAPKKADAPKPAASKKDFDVDFNQGQNTGNLYGGGQQNAFGGFETAPAPGRGSNAFENFGGSSASRPSQVNQDFNNFGGQQNAFGNFDSTPPSASQQQQQGGGFGAFDDPRQVNQGNNAFGNFDNPQQQNFGDFNNFGGGNQRQGRPNVVPPPNDFNQQQNFNDNSASAGNRRRSKDTPFDHDQGFDNHNQGFNNQGGNQGFNNNQGFDNRGQGAFDTPFDQDPGHHSNRGHGGSQAFDNSNQGRGGPQDFSEFGSGWDPNPNQGFDQNQGFNEKVKGAGNKGHENNQGFDQHNQGHGGGNQDFGEFGSGWDNNNQGFDQNQGFNDNRGGRGGNQGFDNNQSRGGQNQGFDQGWDNNNQGFDNSQQGFGDNRDNRDNRRNQNANQGFDNSPGWDNSNQGFDNSQGFNENRRGAGNKQPENNQGFDNSQQGFSDNRDNRDNRRNQNANQGFDNSNQGWDNSNQGFNSNQGRGGNNQGFDQGWDNGNQGFDQNQGFNDNRGGRGGNQGFDSNQGRGGNNQGFDQGWDNNNQGFNSNQGRGGNNQGFDQGWDNNNQGFDNNHENGQVPFQNTPVIEVSESLRGIRGKPKEEKKPAANNFDDMWDSGNLEVPPPQKNDGGIGFDDFGDFNSATHGGSAFDSYNNNQQQQQQQQFQQQQQQASRNQSQGQQQGNQRSEFGDAFEWGAPPPERKPYQSPPTGSFNNEFNNDFNNDYRQQQQQQQQQSQYQQDQRYPQQRNDNQFEAPKRFDSFGGESQQVPQRFGNETRFDNFNKPEARSQNYGSDNKSPSMSNLNQNFAPPPTNFNNEPRRDFPQRHDFTQDLTGGYGNNQFKNERPPIRNEVTPPTMYSQSMGGVSNSGFNMGRSMDTHSNYNMLSTNTLVAQNAIPAKMGDMESERLRRERDKILSELDNVKRLYNGLKVEHDHMKMSNNVVGGDFNKLKYEVDDLKRTQGELAMNSQQLRMENEGFRHQRGAMTSENAGHMRLFEDMSREIAQLKGKLTDHDFNDRRRKNEAHVMNLETSLKNAQFQVDSMQTLHHRVANEYNKANSELDKLKLGHYVPPQTNLPSNLIPQIQATAQSIGRPSFSPPRARSRSPGMDLMNIIGDPMPRYSNPTRTSVVNSVVGLRYSPTRSDVDRRMDYASGNVLYSSPPRAEPEVVNTRMSPPRLPESLYGPNVDRTVPPLFSKYTNQGQAQANQPIGLHDIQIQQIQAPLYDLSRLPPIPDKYTRTSVTPMYPAEQGYTFQAPTGPLGAITAIGGREGNLAKSTLINPNPVATSTNPANRKASDLIEKAKRLRESASRGGDSFRESVNVRPSIPANEGRYFAQNPSSVYQTAVKTSPKRYSPGRGNLGSELNMDDLRRGDTTNYKQSIMNRSPPSLMVSHTKMGGLPQGLYRGSPVRERIVNREEVIELKPTESLKIVERPVRSSPNRVRGKSPGQVNKVKSDENIAIGQNAVSLAQTLKNDIQMFKRGVRGSPEAATINPNKNNQYDQEGGLIANKYQYNKGTSVESTLQGVTISANDFGGRRNEMLSDNEEAKIRQVSGVPGVKLTVGDNYFQGATTTPKKYFQEPIPVRESGPEGVTQYNVAGKKVRGKQGKMMIYDHGMFDQFTNTIYGYTHYRDVDAYKSACLTSRATLFDSPNLQITVITKNENDEVLKAIVHFTNKSNNDISEFSSYPMDTSVQSNPIVQGATLAPKYQLKQELFIHFMDFREMPYILDISYKHENSSKQMNLALPITINKFMKFRHGVERNTFKGAWKQLKTRAVTTGYRNINAKFVRNPVEIKKYFDNNLLDVTPHLNPKHKKKYGGIFVLPDNREYYVKFTMDTSRIKILASSGRDEPGYEEWVAQYLSFLLTV